MTALERVFLLSPAHCGGKRARMLMSGAFPLANQLQSGEGAPLGDVFSFLSGLYFRGKLAYSTAFAHPSAGAPGVLVITPSAGLLPLEYPLTRRMLVEFSDVDLGSADPRFREPFLRDTRRLASHLGLGSELVLLGSIATGKYVDVLIEVFGRRLLFPAAFVGRGDMSRGGLLLRSARSGVVLDHVPVVGAVRSGPRPPKLARLS